MRRTALIVSLLSLLCTISRPVSAQGLGNDNIWTNNNRFKGPIPYVDFTAFMPAGGCSSTSSFATPTATMTSGMGTATLSSAQDFKNGCGIMVEGAGPTSTLTTPAAPTIVSHVTGGSTTIKYAVVWVDNNEGYSKASATTSFTTSDTYANLTLHHYNYLTVASAPAAALLGCVYSDKGTGGALVGIGCAPVVASGNVQFGFQDWGQVLPFPAFLPTNPPGAAGPQALFTTISTGGGTINLTLAANASNNVSGTSAYHDESQFLYNAWVQAESVSSSGYVYIPPGLYYFGHIVPYTPNATQIHVTQVGDVYLDDFPLFFSQNNFEMFWDGTLGGHNPQQFGVWPTAFIVSNNSIPQTLVSNSNFLMANVEVRNVQGDGFYATGSGGASLKFEQFSVVGNSAEKGCPVRVDGNVIGMYMSYFVLSGSTATVAPGAICFNNLTQGVGDAQVFIDHGWLINTAVTFDSPSNLNGNVGMQATTFEYINTENQLQKGFLNVDQGSGTQVFGIVAPTMRNVAMDTTRAGGFTAVNCINTTNGSCVTGSFFVINTAINPFSTSLAGSLSQNDSTLKGTAFVTVNPTSHNSSGFQMFGLPRGGETNLGGLENLLGSSYGAASEGGVGDIAGAMILPPPKWNTGLSASNGGSLAAGTYCYEVASMDLSGGESVPGLEQCITVTLNQQVTLSLLNNMGGSTGCYKVYRGPSAGGENVYLNLISTCGTVAPVTATLSAGIGDGAGFTYVDTGGITTAMGTPKTFSGAYTTAFSFDGYSFINSGYSAGNPYRAVGIGTTCQDGGMNTCGTDGVKLDVKGAFIRGQNGLWTLTQLKGSETTAPAGAANIDNLWADSTSHRWKMINNNGTTDYVVGAADIRATYDAFLPANLTSTWTGSKLTLDKAITVTRVQVQVKTAPSGCSTNAVVRLSDGSTNQDVTVSAAANDSGAVTKNYSAAAALTIAVQTAASGCSTSPADANVVVQYRMQ